MLNEGYVLYKSLERCGILLTNRHPDVKEPGKREGLIVGIDKNGEVTRLEYRKAEGIAKLWTTREGMHNSFPVLKLQRPLWKIGPNDSIRKKDKNEKEKRKLLTEQNHRLNITAGERTKWKSLRERVNTLRPFFEPQDKDFSALYELMNRFLLIQEVAHFAEGLLKMVKKFQSEISYSLYETILIGNKWDATENEYRAEVPLVLDVSDWQKYTVRVASPKMEPFVSDCLFKKQKTGMQVNIQNARPSALSGRKVQLENDKFPNPKLPVIGNTYLFAVNDQTPCQTRYKKTATDIIPIGREEATAIQNSLNWTTEDERKGKTWYPTPSIRDGESDLLIVYLENKPDAKANKAYMLGGQTNNPFSESTYEAYAGVAIQALQGEEIIKACDLIRLFAFRKADPGRTLVSLQRVYTIAQLVEADKDWLRAVGNIPRISISFFRDEIERETEEDDNIPKNISKFLEDMESKITFLSPRCPFPADLVRVTQKQWIRFGQETKSKRPRENSSVAGASLGDVYDVFFAQKNEQRTFAENLLSLTLQRTLPLLIGLGEAEHKSRARTVSYGARFTALTTISALGIYLHKLGIRKEQYMKDTFFYVGRVLSLIDTLHLEYCKGVRDGSIPPQLLGNAHLQIALDNPVSALDLLSRRIGVYQAWTRKEQGDHVKLARWAVGQLGKVTALLSEKTLPSSTTSAERAQILLGYLAKSEEIEQVSPN